MEVNENEEVTSWLKREWEIAQWAISLRELTEQPEQTTSLHLSVCGSLTINAISSLLIWLYVSKHHTHTANNRHPISFASFTEVSGSLWQLQAGPYSWTQNRARHRGWWNRCGDGGPWGRHQRCKTEKNKKTRALLTEPEKMTVFKPHTEKWLTSTETICQMPRATKTQNKPESEKGTWRMSYTETKLSLSQIECNCHW